MSTLDTIVFLFGVLISFMVLSGFMLLFYGRAYVEQARREKPVLGSGMKRLARLLGEEPA